MGETTKKAKNRLISFACLGVFALSLVVATFSIYRITSLYKERQVLEATKQKMIEEQTYLKNQNTYLNDEEYLNVYFDGTYTGYDMQETLIIIKK